jgi:hypothetical protein
MPVKFYASFFCLNTEDRKFFEILCEEDEALENAISDCANMWRNSMRKVHPDPIQCRQAFLKRAVLMSAKDCIRGGYGCLVAAAFALFLCDRVEQRVRALDFEEETPSFPFRQ